MKTAKFQNIDWFLANYETLSEKYPDQWLAISNNQVIATALSPRELREKLDKINPWDQVFIANTKKPATQGQERRIGGKSEKNMPMPHYTKLFYILLVFAWISGLFIALGFMLSNDLFAIALRTAGVVLIACIIFLSMSDKAIRLKA